MNKVLVTGGAGYKGCVLVPKLLSHGYEVAVYDLMLFGSAGLPTDPHLEVVKGDIRDTKSYASAVKGSDAVIHMACISNDPSFELDPRLSTTINYDCFEPIVKASREAGVRRFVYVSSSSVYGVSNALEVTEEEFLLGECRFPNGVALIVRIASSKVYTGGVMLPTCRPENGWHGHKFVIPGIDFTLHVGSRIPEEIVRSSFALVRVDSS